MTSATQARLTDPVSLLRGVGPRRAAALCAAGVETIQDILLRLPVRHEMYPASQSIRSLQSGRLATVVGEVIRSRVARSRRQGAGHLHIRIKDNTGEVEATFFNQAYLKTRLARGEWCQITGSVAADGGGVRLSPRYVDTGIDSECPYAPERWVAVYPGLAGVPKATWRSLVDQSFGVFTDRPDPISAEIRKDRDLMEWGDALRCIHNPTDAESLSRAEERLLYNSLVCHAILAAHFSAQTDSLGARPDVRVTPELAQRISEIFPFPFTEGQRAAVNVISQELQGEGGLRRLLIGDVGCGKTVVGIWAMAAALANGFQVAVLAPTTTLAHQWHKELIRFRPLGEQPILLIGGMPAAERRTALEQLRMGGARIVVGTHSLLHSEVLFDSLGLMVVDEQHRFGVLQRLALTRRGGTPHVLAMSATPIPRTLALCLYGDDSPIEIRDRPRGHGAIQTHLYRRTQGSPFDWRAAAARVKDGARIYVVFPSIESEDGALPSLLEHGRRLAERFFAGVSVGFLHGGLPPQEKTEVLDRFRSGEVQVLMTTTVIEVGVDIREAQEIILVGAERFGLAQAHQLRGRVGRGTTEGHCHLIVSNAAPEGELRRLSILLESSSGFEIATRDLELRGPGDIMGLRQHGSALVPLAAISEDRLTDAVEDARRLSTESEDLLRIASDLGTWSRGGRLGGDDLTGAI